MGVITLNEGSNPIESYLRDWMQKRQQDQMQQRQLSQQQSQFEQTLALDKQRTDAQTGLYGAQTDASKYNVSADQAKVTAAAIKENYDALVRVGLIDQATRLARGAAARYANEPEVQRILQGMTMGRQSTDLDTTAANTARFAATQTGIAAGGSQDAQARAFTQENALGRGMTAHQFGDQVQREAGPQDYARFVDVEGGRAPNANVTAQIASNERMAREDIAARGASGGAGTGAAGESRTDRDSRIITSVDDLLGRVGGWTAGLGSKLAPVPGTDARDFRADLDTLKANIAFGELQAMREASKTGGALGQVAIREIELLESSLGALDQGQSPESLKRNLEKIRGSLTRWNSAAGGSGAGPQVGDTKRAQNGRLLYFDGNGWTDPPAGRGASGSW